MPSNSTPHTVSVNRGVIGKGASATTSLKGRRHTLSFMAAALAESATQVDYILVCAEDPAFEAALAEWGGDVPVEYGV